MSQPASRVSANLLHAHTHVRLYTHIRTHLLSSPVTINVILFLLTLGLLCFPSLRVTLSSPWASSPPTRRRLSPCSSSTSVPFSPHCHYQFSTSFFPSIFLCPLSPYLPLSAPLHPFAPFSSFFLLFFSLCARLFPYPAGNNALPLPPVPLSFIVTSLFLHLLSSRVALISTQNRIQEPNRSRA